MNWSGIELFRALAELHPLQLAKQVAQPVVLAGELIALFDQSPLLGPLGVALRPCRQHQGAQRSKVVGKGVGKGVGLITAGIISCRQRYAILNLKVSQRDAAL